LLYGDAVADADAATDRRAEAWGYLTPSDVEQPLRLLDRVLAILWRLTN
jgi:hypothetical protein